jgi:hypothetical protein
VSYALKASLVQRLSRVATRNAVSNSLGGNPSARASVATCVHVVTNAGIVVAVVVVAGSRAGTTCVVVVGACALLALNITKTPITKAIAPVVNLCITICYSLSNW